MGSTKLIRYLNDRFRSTFQGGQVVLTRGIRALPQEEITEILSKVSNFNDFNSDNDPYFEHDGAAFEYNNMKSSGKSTIMIKNTNMLLRILLI